jgi:hypothetical protein
MIEFEKRVKGYTAVSYITLLHCILNCRKIQILQQIFMVFFDQTNFLIPRFGNVFWKKEAILCQRYFSQKKDGQIDK